MNNCIYLFILLGLYLIFFTYSELFYQQPVNKKKNMVK